MALAKGKHARKYMRMTFGKPTESPKRDLMTQEQFEEFCKQRRQ
jgi:hypothetical protein